MLFEHVIIYFSVLKRGGCYIWREYSMYMHCDLYSVSLFLLFWVFFITWKFQEILDFSKFLIICGKGIRSG